MRTYTEEEIRDRDEQAETLRAIKGVKRHKNAKPALEVLREIIATSTCKRHKGMLIDHFTASAILVVYDALQKPEMKEQFRQIIETNILKASSIAFKLCK